MADDTYNPMDFFYTKGGDRLGDKGGMRAVGNMTEDEAKQALCQMIHFGFWHEAHQAAYEKKRQVVEAAVEQLFSTSH